MVRFMTERAHWGLVKFRLADWDYDSFYVPVHVPWNDGIVYIGDLNVSII